MQKIWFNIIACVVVVACHCHWHCHCHFSLLFVLWHLPFVLWHLLFVPQSLPFVLWHLFFMLWHLLFVLHGFSLCYSVFSATMPWHCTSSHNVACQVAALCIVLWYCASCHSLVHHSRGIALHSGVLHIIPGHGTQFWDVVHCNRALCIKGGLCIRKTGSKKGNHVLCTVLASTLCNSISRLAIYAALWWGK